jgi:RoxA-like, cytochrome c-like
MKLLGTCLRMLSALAITLIAVGCSRSRLDLPTADPKSPQEFFELGSIGSEVVPSPVFVVLPELSPENFQPAGPDKGDWIDQFGFVRRPDPKTLYGLPYGFTISHHEPGTGSNDIRLPYVGLTCAACHVGQIRLADKNLVVSGMGNASLDVVAFGDAVRCAIMDSSITAWRLRSAYNAKFEPKLGIRDTIYIYSWLKKVREKIQHDLKIPGSGKLHCGAELRQSELLPGGPGRVMATRDAIKRLKHEIPEQDGGPSKLPVLYHQGREEWAQFDGSVRNPLTRNAISALSVGATPQNLATPGILATMEKASAYERSLQGPNPKDVFPQVDQNSVAEGRKLYTEACAKCHGSPDEATGDWKTGERLGQAIPLAEIGTDPERVTSKYYADLPNLLWGEYPDGLKPQLQDLRSTGGYISTPLESVFSRAPYLHNGSIPTLAELINLKPRRNAFCRGADPYDVTDVGLAVSVSEKCDPKSAQYYRVDTTKRGNSNKGHDYPWPYRGNGWDEAKLKNLLEYLKTL